MTLASRRVLFWGPKWVEPVSPPAYLAQEREGLVGHVQKVVDQASLAAGEVGETAIGDALPDELAVGIIYIGRPELQATKFHGCEGHVCEAYGSRVSVPAGG